MVQSPSLRSIPPTTSPRALISTPSMRPGSTFPPRIIAGMELSETRSPFLATSAAPKGLSPPIIALRGIASLTVRTMSPVYEPGTMFFWMPSIVSVTIFPAGAVSFTPSPMVRSVNDDVFSITADSKNCIWFDLLGSSPVFLQSGTYLPRLFAFPIPSE